ncbi:MAG: glycine--tRNA ligase, partial [Candidatus Pacebacteria bacterium CG10_big_fil_rev_8_21_14_0_10_42_12]
KRYRADHLIEEWIEKKETDSKLKEIVVEDMSVTQMADFIKTNKIKSPDGNEITEPKDFNILFESAIGSVSGEKSVVYLRGETAQGIFTNFKNILDSTRVQLPFGVGQIGKSFRNEITTGQFIFRTLEFEQAEIEFFFDPEETNWEVLFQAWRDAMWHFVTQTLGVSEENLQWRRHSDAERSHYSKDTYDLDYVFPFGTKELWGVAYRTDYDLKQHIQHSGRKLEYRNPFTNKVFVPHVIEPALGLNRVLLMLLCDSLTTIEGRTVLKIKPSLAPYRAAVFPLLSNKPELIDKAKTVFDSLLLKYPVVWDSRGNIGKRYASQDEIGTPLCITIDFDTLENNTVTVRHRDTAEQERVSIDELEMFINKL